LPEARITEDVVFISGSAILGYRIQCINDQVLK
jgi:hypothetical protein